MFFLFQKKKKKKKNRDTSKLGKIWNVSFIYNKKEE